MDISAHQITDLVISSPETRQHTKQSTPYQVVKVTAIDAEGNETELVCFSRDGGLNIHQTEGDSYEKVRDIHRAIQARKREERKQRDNEVNELVRLAVLNERNRNRNNTHEMAKLTVYLNANRDTMSHEAIKVMTADITRLSRA